MRAPASAGDRTGTTRRRSRRPRPQLWVRTRLPRDRQGVEWERGCAGPGLPTRRFVPANFVQRLGKNPRREGRDYAVAVGHARAQANQREHVGAAVDQRCPETLKEWKATPQDHRSRQRELKPGEI